jgi:murein DD-endopeptidase MepM/ murein hydrolase activator NlpD
MLPSQHAYLLAALAASAALTLALSVEQPILAQAGRGIDFSLVAARSTPTVTSTGEPQATPLTASEAEALLASLLGVTPTPVTAEASAPPLPVSTPEPAAPHLCPIVPEQGAVVLLRGAQPSAQGSAGILLAVDGDGDGYAEPASTRRAAVVAAHDGVVQVMLDSWPGGNQVVVEGREGWRSTYAHLASIDVEAGQHVEAGQVLGQAGNTGRAAGPHLELEVEHNGQPSDASGELNCTS